MLRRDIGALFLALGAAAMGGCTSAPPTLVAQARPAPSIPSGVPPLPPAQIDNSLTVGGEAIKARMAESRMTVDVRLNGRGPYRFIVDSGADTSVVGTQVARDLQLPVGPAAMLNSMTARTLVGQVSLDSMTVGPTTITGLALPALQEENLGAQGLIGIDALVHQRLLMDFDRRVIRIESAQKPMKFERGAIVIVAKRRRGQLILTHVRAGRVSLDAIIDTGSEVTIGNTALRDKLLLKGGNRIDTMDITGVTGTTITVPVVIVNELQLGPILLQNVPIAFADVPPFDLFGLSREPALLLGTDLLQNFRSVSLDFRARKVRFQLKRCNTTGVLIDTTRSHTASLLSANDPEVC